jgi:hypothetical protein
VCENPFDRQVYGGGQRQRVGPDLDDVTDLVGDRDTDVVAVGHHQRSRHPVESLTHTLGGGPQPVANHLIGQRIQVVGSVVPQFMQGQFVG